MRRNKRHVKGQVYYINDNLLVEYSKQHRRVVVVNDDPQNAHVMRIMGLYDKNNMLRKNLVPIERYNFTTKASGIERKVYKKTRKGQPIQTKYMKSANGRLNKWDMSKIKHPYEKK